MITAPHRYSVNVNEWHQMTGIFQPEQHLQLINGEITLMSPIGHRHSGHLNNLVHLFRKKLLDESVLSIQNPLQLNSFSEPEPDLMLLKPESNFYKHRHPNANDVLLLIEIADSSLYFDRQQKLKLYAQHHIIDYWIVNLNASSLEIYRQPQHDNYQQQDTLMVGETIQPLAFPEMSVEIADIF